MCAREKTNNPLVNCIPINSLAKQCKTQRGGTLPFLRDFSDRSAPSGEEANKRKQTHVVVLRCAVCTLFEFLEQ